MNDEQNKELQRITRRYLGFLSPIAEKFGLGKWLKEIIDLNEQDKCSATEEECRMLTRLCDDERVARHDIPKMIGKSYRNCVDNEIFERLKTLKRVGIYDKISVLLFKKSQK